MYEKKGTRSVKVAELIFLAWKFYVCLVGGEVIAVLYGEWLNDILANLGDGGGHTLQYCDKPHHLK